MATASSADQKPLYSCRVRNNTNLPIICHAIFRTWTDDPLAGSKGTAFEQEDNERVLHPGEIVDFGENATTGIDVNHIREHITRIYADDGIEQKRRTEMDVPLMQSGQPDKDFCEFLIYEDADLTLQIDKII